MIRKILFNTLVFTSILAAQANNLNEQIQLAQTYVQTKQFDKAEIIYKALIAAQPQNNLFIERLNKVYLYTKNYDASIALLTDRIKKFPQDISAYGQLGGTYHAMDNLEKAFEIWNSGLQIRPDLASNYRLIAHYIIERRALDEGIAVLKDGREKIGKPDLFAYDLSSLYTTMMKFKEAAEEYCVILINEPNQLATVKARLNGYIFRADALEKTIEVVNQIADNEDSPQLYGLLSFLYQASGNYDKALEHIINFVSDAANSDKILLDFAEEALNKNQYTAASKSFEMLIEKYGDSPQSSKARLGLARALEMEDDSFRDSIEVWKPIRISKPTHGSNTQKAMEQYHFITKNIDNPEIKSEAYYRMALIYKDKLNSHNAADSLFLFIVNQTPSSIFSQRALIELGEIEIAKDSITRAEAYFERAIRIRVSKPDMREEANFLLIKSKFWSNKFKEASSLISDFARNLSNDRTNDAIELSMLINSSKNDSIGLSNYAGADFLTEQGKIREASDIFKTLSQASSGSILSEFSKYRYAQLLIAQNELPIAIAMLEEIAESELIKIFADKALYLQAQIYHYGIKDKLKAINIYEKLLANFPNSLYLDKARENIIILKPKY